MDKTITYQKIVQKVLDNFVTERSNNNSPIVTQLIADTDNHHYQIVRTGWLKNKQIYNVIFHIDIINEKIWLQRNVSDYDIVEDIEQMGVPKTDIVLAFHSPTMRQHTGYAIA
jgi:protein gp37